MSRWSASTTAPPAVSAEPSSAARTPTAEYLNKVRAGIARLPGDSEFTSGFDRIQGRAARQRGAGPSAASRFDGWLTPIQVEGDGQEYPAGQRASDKGVLSISLDEYLELLDWTARELRMDQGGAVPHRLPLVPGKRSRGTGRPSHGGTENAESPNVPAASPPRSPCLRERLLLKGVNGYPSGPFLPVLFVSIAVDCFLFVWAFFPS